MPTETNQDIARAFVQLTLRAEIADPVTLVQTFVDIGTLLPSISTRDNQVVFGRRGTGKTHALRYTLEKAREAGSVAVYVDLRLAGSSSSIYSNPNLPLPERATRLILDVLNFLHNELLKAALDYQNLDLSLMGPLLDRLADSITEVHVYGETSIEKQVGASTAVDVSSGASAALSRDPAIRFSADSKRTEAASNNEKVTQSGKASHRLHFGALSTAMTAVIQGLSRPQIVLALDEWVAIPYDLQPYLADLLRRALFPLKGLVVKIAAIEQRSSFRIRGEHGDYIGIEVGGDVSTAINLDDFMVFENDETRATKFLRDLVYKHYKAEVPATELASGEELVRSAFTQANAFEELVIAAEGVPRDAINILSVAAQKASDRKISIPDIRNAARNWYIRGKEATVNSDPEAQRLLHWIIDQVIGARKSRAFLLRSGTRHKLIDTLFDERVLHIIKRGMSAQDQPGVRYDAYKIDYGVYVDLISTDKETKGLLATDHDSTVFVDVPPDDYRAIRRAILDLTKFASHASSEIVSSQAASQVEGA